MQRDMDLVRDILLAVEAKATPRGVSMREFEVPDRSDSVDRRKHFLVMAEAGFFEFEATRSSTNSERLIDVIVFDLSWKGHEYLDAIRDPTIWNNTKKGLKKVGGSSFDFVIDLAKSLARKALIEAGFPIA